MICADWVTESELVACNCPDASPAVLDPARTQASEILYALSGRQFSGSCTETVRPCSGGQMLPGFSWGRWTYPWIPMKYGATWINIGPACGCHMAYDCGCKGIPQVNLGRHDVNEILSVTIDGETLSSLNYRLDPGGLLVRTDGEHWPCCQDLAKDLGEEGTWGIELAHGIDPPQSGRLAAARLTTELVKACTGADCALPARVSSVVRQGVAMTMLDPFDFLNEGRTGLYEVDLFLEAVNPHGLSRRATAWSPEVAGKGRRVGVIGS